MMLVIAVQYLAIAELAEGTAGAPAYRSYDLLVQIWQRRTR